MESTAVPTSRALTVAATARRLALSEKTIRRAIARGELVAFRVGRSVRIPERTIDDLITGKDAA